MRKFKIYKIIIAITFCFASVINSFAGDNKKAEQELAKVRESYDKISDLSMDVQYQLFSNHTSANVLEEHKGFYCKQGKDNFYMELYGTLTIQNKDYLFVKEDSSKVLVLAKHKPATDLTPAKVDFEKLLTLCAAVKEIPAVGNIKGYKLFFGNDELLDMSSVEIYFDQTTFITKKIILFYNSKLETKPEKNERKFIRPRLEINYVNINTSPVIEKKQFDFSKYLTKNGNVWKTQKAYSDFELMDQTNIK